MNDCIKDEYKSTCCRVITKEWTGDAFKARQERTTANGLQMNLLKTDKSK